MTLAQVIEQARTMAAAQGIRPCDVDTYVMGFLTAYGDTVVSTY